MDRILLVGDDVEVRPLLEPILLDNGFRVTTAVSVAIATELLIAQPFDLAICDVNLPDARGLAVADEAIAARVKALVVIGRGAGLKPRSLARYNYLLKPLHVSEFLDRIEHCLADKGGEFEVIQVPNPTARAEPVVEPKALTDRASFLPKLGPA